MKFKGRAFGSTARIEFDIMTLGELRVEDIRDFDVDSLNLEFRPASSGIKIVGIWEGPIEKAGEGIKKALEESAKLRERIMRRIKAKTDSIRSTMLRMGFREEVMGYGNALRFIKRVGEYEIVVVVSTTDNVVRVEVYGNEGKIIGPEIQSIFGDVEIEELEVYDLEDERDERLVINLEIPQDDESPDRKIAEAIKLIENMLMT
ncbi:MAG: hypothetical protein J7K48_05985 [Thermococcus sp.]|uniref:Uncharacterized protein n=1 Tax=Thermococcus guaymasensis DSM 11113 TaxID=1432656 RepID=A0A0X1KM44_9EURY|nr:hypothetical protein [Thermococcus guaymasensis]AJC72305.1 hypothetical protein X802_09245 [Thermococcus guaymasensis DSM 11113]MCD6524531.1 hypothetical protein [Thermococcus sp.]